MLGLGCMRLSTLPTRIDARSIEVIHAALDAGATLLDTADAYCLDESDTGHNEKLIAEALRTWRGDRTTITVATKGGIRRPGGAWVPDGRATHLRAACDASRAALGIDMIDLYQLHVVDPRAKLETSVRALADLQRAGKIRRIGLCNLTVGQIETARRIAEISSVQVSLSLLDAENLRNGVAEYCRDQGIQLIAYRPLGGTKGVTRLANDSVLRQIAAAHDVTVHEIALAWLLQLDPLVVPIPGATRVETASSIARSNHVDLTAEDLDRLGERFPEALLLRQRRSARRPSAPSGAEVVLVMGMPAAGKSVVAQEFVNAGYARLNRDERGGRLSDLVDDLDAGLVNGGPLWVLDNTYGSRKSRNEVIECAWRHGASVRCVWLTTAIPDAQINAVTRILQAHGRLPSPEELRTIGKNDPRFFGPDAQFRYERQLEPPVLEEGFSGIEQRAFVRVAKHDHAQRAVLLEYDGVLSTSAQGNAVALDPADVAVENDRRTTLARYAAEGYRLLSFAWRPQISEGQTAADQVEACFQQTRSLLGLDVDIAFCPHVAGPPICWCRKPLPGLVLQFAERHRLALDRCLLVGRAQADRTLATRLGITYYDQSEFF
jgi:aryl-alcohol dehydrogenase-like predicted oxidoreductase/histidinol phosphatase-like enzyme